MYFQMITDVRKDGSISMGISRFNYLTYIWHTIYVSGCRGVGLPYLLINKKQIRIIIYFVYLRFIRVFLFFQSALIGSIYLYISTMVGFTIGFRLNL